MTKQMKSFVAIVVITILSLITINSVYAADDTNFSVKLTSSISKVKPSETVDVFVALGDFTQIGEGINAFMADLQYDSAKLTIDSNSIVAQNGWDAPTYDDGELLTLKGSMITQEEVIMKMTFTVKADAASGVTTITIKNAEAANTENDFIGKDGVLNIEIAKEEVGNPGDDNQENQNPGDDNQGNQNPGDENPGDDNQGNQNPEDQKPSDENQNNQKPTKPENNVDDTVAGDKIPQTGVKYIGMIVLGIALIVVGIVSYRKYTNSI